MSPVIRTAHALLPMQAAPHPVSVAPGSGRAISLTTAWSGSASAQSVPQVMPAGRLTMRPRPLTDTVSVLGAPARVNVAVQVSGFVIVIGPVPHEIGSQPANDEPALGVAVKVTLSLTPYGRLQALPPAPHTIPPGELVTVPAPSPCTWTVMRSAGEFLLNAAVHVRLAVICTVFAQPTPLHPPNVDPAAAVGTSVTVVPALKFRWHDGGHTRPSNVTKPEPVPPTAIVRVRVSAAASRKSAPTVVSVASVRVQVGAVPAGVQASVQRSNTRLALVGNAVRVKTVPCSAICEQSPPQLIPCGASMRPPDGGVTRSETSPAAA